MESYYCDTVTLSYRRAFMCRIKLCVLDSQQPVSIAHSRGLISRDGAPCSGIKSALFIHPSIRTMIGRQSSSSTESLVPLKDLGGSPLTAGPSAMLVPPPSQSCFLPTSDMRASMSSSSASSANSSNRSLMELLGEYQRRNNGIFPDRKRNASEVDRHIVVFDEAKMTRRIEKDIKRGRLTRVRSSDSFLEGKVEMSRRMMRSYLSFGYESGASLDKLSRQLQKHDRSSFNTVGESSKTILAMNSKNEMFDQIDCQDAEMLRRASAAASAGRALLSR